MSLVSLSLVKQFLNISPEVTSSDPWLSGLIEGASATVKSYCGRDFEPATYTEYYTGDSRRDLYLRQRPVTAITSIHLDLTGGYGQTTDTFGSTTLLTQGVDYALVLDGSYNGAAVSFSGLVTRLRAIWPEVQRHYFPPKLTKESVPSLGTIKVVYSAGYNPVPVDIKYAVAFLVSYMRRTIPHGAPMLKERIGDYSYEIGMLLQGKAAANYPDITSARQILSRYREVIF